jgi:lipoprotein-anchoring transpeptidase ErfK/SrfK
VRTRVRSAASVLAVLGLTAALAGCSGSDEPNTSPVAAQSPRAGKPATAAPTAPAQFAVTPANGTASVRLDGPVKVTVTGGKLTSVTVAGADGVPLLGAFAAGGTVWSSTAPLAAGARYTVSAAALTAAGQPATSTSSFTTLAPDKTVSASVVPGEGWTVGIGMPVIVNFSRPIKDRAAAVRALTVTSTPKVEGAWRWFSSEQVQWRPRAYWPAGTKVTVTTALAGVEISPGVWGKRSKSTTFQVGSAMISTVDVNAHTLTVRRDGQVIRTIPVTTGKQGFTTRNGVKVIMSRESSRQMDAETTGIARDNPEYYNLNVKYAMRLTHSGEFLHAAPWSVGSQGRANVSHGCTGMSTENARWLFSQSKVGDVVVYTGSKRPLEWGNGYTAWDMPFEQWSTGS